MTSRSDAGLLLGWMLIVAAVLLAGVSVVGRDVNGTPYDPGEVAALTDDRTRQMIRQIEAERDTYLRIALDLEERFALASRRVLELARDTDALRAALRRCQDD